MALRKEPCFVRLKELVELGWTNDRIGKELNITHVERYLKRAGIPRRKTGPRSGEGHPDWSGGRIYDADGYVLLYRPNHPMCRHTGRKVPTYVAEHRLVMSEHLGRLLTKDEVVHHKNGIKDDNRIENLELFSENSEHLKHELTGRVPKWTEYGKQRMKDAIQTKAANLRGLTLHEYRSKGYSRLLKK